jgi:DNA repair exonuclease SbcCD ATPase subunit
MLSLKELKFRGIGRFAEEQRIAFDNLGNLVQVDGQNCNTNGSSGSGKSTIFNALDFLLGLNSIPNSVLQSRETDEPMWVEGSFDYNGSPLIITRGKKLKIELNGEVTTGSAKLSEEKLDQILSIPRQLFRPMLHKRQGERGFFLNFTPKETNDFLTDCLGLSNFKKPMLELDNKLQELGKRKESLSIDLESAKTGLSASQNAIASLGLAPVKEIDQTTIVRLKATADASKMALQTLLSAQQAELADLEAKRPISTAIPFDTSKKSSHERELENLKIQINQLLLAQKDKENEINSAVHVAKAKQRELENKIERGSQAKDRATKEALKIKKIRESLCPTCEQSWANDAAKKEEGALLESINQLRAQVLEGEQASAQLGSVREEIRQLTEKMPLAIPDGYQELLTRERFLMGDIALEIQKEREYAHERNEKTKALQAFFASQHKTMRDKHAVDAEQLRNQVALDSKVFDAAVAQLKSYEESRVRYENSLNNLKAQELTYSEKVSKISQALSLVNNDIESYEELKKAVKSYLSCSFDEALETISDNSTRLIRNIPNMANATIQLIGLRETKEGKIKEEVTAVLNLDGDENIDIRSLSGGERTSADLAIDLAVLDMIESRTNVGTNIFILDEPFNGLDTTCIEATLEMLRNYNNKKLLIVEHNPIISQFISQKITVIRDGQTSRVEYNS